MNPYQFVVYCVSGWLNRELQEVIIYLLEEIRVLKELLGKPPRLNDRQRRRLAVKANALSWSRLKEFANVATPQTLINWHKKLVAMKYDSSQNRKFRKAVHEAGDRKVGSQDVQRERAVGIYENLRCSEQSWSIHRNTVANILKDHGIEPAPERGPQTTWADFLKRHWHVMAATDFLTVEICTLRGIVRYHVHFVIKLATREVYISGISPAANGLWMEQIACNLTDGVDGFLNGYQFLIQDRDPLFTVRFKKTLCDEGIKMIRLPRRSPNLNAFAERFVRSIKDECLDRMIFFSEKSLRYAIREYAEHYHHERNHQGLDSRIIEPQFAVGGAGEIKRHERIGGLLNYYCREAA